MEYTDAYADASDLTGVARGAYDAFIAQYLLDTYLPSVENQTLTYDFTINDLPLADSASFRSWNTGADYGRTEGSTSKSGKLPPISRAYRVDELDMLQIAGQTDGVQGVQEGYARRAGIAIAARIVKAQAQAIEYGQLTLAERGLNLLVDYGRNPALSTTVPTYHGTSGSKPIDDLLAAQDNYLTYNGTYPGVNLISPRVLAAWQKNADIIAAIYAGSASTPSRAKASDVISVLTDFGVVNPTVYSQVIDRVPVFSQNVVLQLPASGSIELSGGPLGTTQLGITAEAINPKYGISGGDRPGVFAAAYDAANPERQEVVGSAVAIPAVSNANATQRIQVLAP